MFGNLPLHPALVHLPLGLVAVLPFVTILVGLASIKAWLSKKVLFLVVFLHVFLSAASYVALETGENEEHTVERVVGEQPIEEHEERAELFMGASSAVLVLSLIVAFLPTGTLLKAGIAALLIGQVGLGFLGYRVGHSGGELVYVHGASKAYSTPVSNADSWGREAQEKSGDEELEDSDD